MSEAVHDNISGRDIMTHWNLVNRLLASGISRNSGYGQCLRLRLRHQLPQSFILAAALLASPSFAQKNYGPGVSDTEIKIGQTMPYSGPLSGMGTHGKAMAAYFVKLNSEGGVNGRKINLISLDDGYSPPKTVEQTRKLVEQEQV